MISLTKTYIVRHDTKVTGLRIVGFVAFICVFVLSMVGMFVFYFCEHHLCMGGSGLVFLATLWLARTPKTYLHEFVWDDD